MQGPIQLRTIKQYQHGRKRRLITFHQSLESKHKAEQSYSTQE
ncbi:unnamed protein product [Arabidopsis thaliana]|uniref:Uncharacterized protein n=2 Tax=Arabidopsis thaliana TaxID=3702 RepID=A0A654GF57_ARATH|nr:uncharacterized protein AT2G07632 [Arabidopsis thaliana]ANM63003.1 hypothetical protein AT2G07632 [Arabidopsis thaliana]CAA0413842.1 unnamed protein product [Arabidopsis thaliana]VYS71751.1 unnamed protein product [Arabidopsis thaliana]|eukprot:NP_001325120.1 hypothetical protein AT2G07632 [Arabidopsis thaliana]